MRPVFTRVAPVLKSHFVAKCDAQEDDDDEPSDLMKQADSLLKGERKRFTTPAQFDKFAYTFSAGKVNNYDGCRFIVQKQVNLNTAVSHFFWFGTAARPPMYQYRITIPQDEGSLTVATDMDFNIEGELNIGIPTPENSALGNLNFKSEFVMGDEAGTQLSMDLERSDESSTCAIHHSVTENATQLNYLQTVYPGLVLGGQLGYQYKAKQTAAAFAGSFTHGEHLFMAQWDHMLQAMYLRRVNEGRASISANLVVDPQGNSTASACGEFNLKTGKVTMAIDSNGLIKSMLEHYVGDRDVEPAQAKTIQLCAEVKQHANEYKFGIGFVMG